MGLVRITSWYWSKFQWKPFWLATQRDPQNDWTATQNRVNYDVFAQAPLPSSQSFCGELGGKPRFCEYHDVMRTDRAHCVQKRCTFPTMRTSKGEGVHVGGQTGKDCRLTWADGVKVADHRDRSKCNLLLRKRRTNHLHHETSQVNFALWTLLNDSLQKSFTTVKVWSSPSVQRFHCKRLAVFVLPWDDRHRELSLLPRYMYCQVQTFYITNNGGFVLPRGKRQIFKLFFLCFLPR